MSQTDLKKWEVGDVIRRWDGGKSLVIGLNPKECIWLTDFGKLFYSNRYNSYDFSHNSGLVYKFDTDEKAKRDFNTGLFTKYFTKPDAVTESGNVDK